LRGQWGFITADAGVNHPALFASTATAAEFCAGFFYLVRKEFAWIVLVGTALQEILRIADHQRFLENVIHVGRNTNSTVSTPWQGSLQYPSFSAGTTF
jgi:hypothetical protein